MNEMKKGKRQDTSSAGPSTNEYREEAKGTYVEIIKVWDAAEWEMALRWIVFGAYDLKSVSKQFEDTHRDKKHSSFILELEILIDDLQSKGYYESNVALNVLFNDCKAVNEYYVEHNFAEGLFAVLLNATITTNSNEADLNVLLNKLMDIKHAEHEEYLLRNIINKPEQSAKYKLVELEEGEDEDGNTYISFQLYHQLLEWYLKYPVPAKARRSSTLYTRLTTVLRSELNYAIPISYYYYQSHVFRIMEEEEAMDEFEKLILADYPCAMRPTIAAFLLRALDEHGPMMPGQFKLASILSKIPWFKKLDTKSLEINLNHIESKELNEWVTIYENFAERWASSDSESRIVISAMILILDPKHSTQLKSFEGLSGKLFEEKNYHTNQLYFKTLIKLSERIDDTSYLADIAMRNAISKMDSEKPIDKNNEETKKIGEDNRNTDPGI